MITGTARFAVLVWLVSPLFTLQTLAIRAVPDTADREFLNRAMAASDAELKIARMAPGKAAREETQALARRLATYHVRLSAALREYARFRKARWKAAHDPKLERLIKSFEGKKGRAYEEAFRDLLAKDPAGLIPLYKEGAAGVSDRLLRRVAERVYGELKERRPAAARAHLRQQAVAAQQQGKAKASDTAKHSSKTKRKAEAQTERGKPPRKEAASRRAKAPRTLVSPPSRRLNR